ncbi:MAG: hypothetical protein ACRCYO_18250, partial [Bacteroidia bacterium]
MDKIGYIEIKISGSKGNLDLTPDNYDIRELISMLENAENLLSPNDKKERPVISYGIENGSVKHIFKTSIQYIIGFNAIVGQVNASNSIDFLDTPTAKAFESIQETAAKKNYTFSIKTSLENSHELKVDRTTKFIRTAAIWAEAEFYFYGKITNAGGKGKTNLHILTDNLGTIIVQTPVSFFETLEENIIHKKQYGIRAIGKQNLETGEIDTATLTFVELIDYQPKYDNLYLQELREKAQKSWLGKIDPDNWLGMIRGGYDA